MKILYIANNIPIPKHKSNRIVLTIAEKLSSSCDISFAYPAAIVFPPFSFMKKYKALVKMQPWKDGKFTIAPVRYPRLPGKKLSYLLIDTVRPEKYVDENALPDLCHAHFIMPDGYIACKIKQKYNIPYVVSVRGGDLRHLKTLGNKGIIYKKFITVLNNADKIIVHNRPQQEFITQLGFDSVIIPHGIEREALSTSLQKADDPIVISTVAELIKQKNVDWVIRAAKKYYGKKNIRLQIAGDGVYRDELLHCAGNIPNIHFLGKITREEVLNLLERSSIFAMPSVNETFGLVYLEAAAKRNAIIAHKNEGVDGLFEDGKEMMFCEGEVDFERIINELLENPIKRKNVADAAYEKVRNNMTWEHIIPKYTNIYRQLTAH